MEQTVPSIYDGLRVKEELLTNMIINKTWLLSTGHYIFQGIYLSSLAGKVAKDRSYKDLKGNQSVVGEVEQKEQQNGHSQQKSGQSSHLTHNHITAVCACGIRMGRLGF